MPRVISARQNAAVSPDEFLHQRLASSPRERLSPRTQADDFDAEVERDTSARRTERSFVERERSTLAEALQEVPDDANGFLRWFESLHATGTGQNDPFLPWLADHATAEQLRWFLAQDLANETGFDDLVALTQLKSPADPQMQQTDGFWQAMERSVEQAMHRAMLGSLARTATQRREERIVWESLALGNLMIALASERHYAYQSVGALAVVELITPSRSRFVYAGLERLDLHGAARRYYAFNAALNERHAQDFNREVLHPLVSSDPKFARLIAEGALLRLRANERCLARYRLELWGREGAEGGVASFEYADGDVASNPAPPSFRPERAPAPVIRPVQWRDVSARRH